MKKICILFSALCLVMGLSAQIDEKTKDFRPMEDVNGVTDLTLDSLNKASTARPVPGSSRKGNNPVLFLVGNSTMRTGTLGNGDNGQWGWGYYAPNYFDSNKITVENQALGGTSSRTFYNRLWPDVLKGVRRGDWVVIELGHNDNGPYDEGRARASIKGYSKLDSLVVTIKETGKKETVYSYGEYMRKFIRDIRSRGANPVLLSLTPRNAWMPNDSNTLVRVNRSFGLWALVVANEMKVPFIDLNGITANKFEKFGHEKVNYMFYIDKIHSSEFGAEINARSVAEGIRDYQGSSLGYQGQLGLKQYLLPESLETPVVEGINRSKALPVVFITGDSTVKNEDKDENSMWGWGSVAEAIFDTTRIQISNCAMAGRSARTFLDEGRWDKVYNSVHPGDYVLIQFGHNDCGPINTGKARAEIYGIADSSHVFRMEETGNNKVIYTFGWYLRKFIGDIREKGGIPILLTHTPRNIWKDGKIEQDTDMTAQWTREVAAQTQCELIDVNTLTGNILQKKGEKNTRDFFKKDHTHNSLKGALLNVKTIAKALKSQKSPLAKYLK